MSDESRVYDLFERAQEVAAEDRDAFIERETGGDDQLKNRVLELLALDADVPVAFLNLDADTPAATSLSQDRHASARADAYGMIREMRRAHDLALEAANARPEDLDDWLEERCDNDADLVARVKVLLNSDEEATRQALQTSASNADAGRSIGPYRLLSPLGEGGFGVVWEAEQSEPVRRRVALKVIKPGMDSRAVVARFEAERQALALMDHPYVAKVLDGGVTDDGRPYFVMDLVRGEPITTFCDRAKMRINDRVALFARVCEAVQHAHSKGVIHRDLKPSNILVGYQGDGPAPKVIDFGIAKALHQPLTDATMFTQLGQMIGTPAYMSPEQADLSIMDIDTRSDVYSLGVVLYELLSGQPPLESGDLRKSGLAEIQRIIREVDPPRPSMRIIGRDDADSVASSRRTDSRGLSSVLRRDLDWVVMRCLEKDRGRRYASASELASDLARFLANEPVSAGPPTAGYKASKFVRRHRVGVAVAGILAVTVGAGLFGTIAGLARAATAEAEARREAVRKLDAADFLTRNLITEISPYETGPDTKAMDLIDAASRRIEEDLGEDPLTEAIVRQALGVAYRDLGAVEQGREQLDRAVTLFERLAGSNDEAALEASLAKLDLATALWRLGEGEEARTMSEDALAYLDTRLGPSDLRVLYGRSQLAGAIKHAGDAKRSETIYLEVLNQAKSADVDEDWRTTTQYNLALAVQSQGRAEEAREIFERVLDVQAALFGSESAVAVRTRSELASCYARLGRDDESEALFEQVLPQLSKIFGDDHPRTIEALANTGVVAVRRGDPASGAALLEDALTKLVQSSTWSHPHAGPITTHLARAKLLQEDVPGAVAAIDLAIEGFMASDLEAETAHARSSSLACAAVETFRDVDPEAAARFETLCSH